MISEDKRKSVVAAAQRILDAYGGHETSDSSRVMYTVGDLNIARDLDTLEIIFRGSLVFRDTPEGATEAPVFEEHGVWFEEVERIAQMLPESPSANKVA